MAEKTPQKRLAAALVVETYLRWQLKETRDSIDRLEKEIVDWERKREIAYRESRFTIEETHSDEEPDRIHRGGCQHNRGASDFLEGPEAALQYDERGLTACEICNPLPGLRSAVLNWTPPLPEDGV
ncbi:DUF6233 domain-containing protein [Streptomyces sp. NPDC050095]|uniref:DUF6233 domain-containing protein n=1 Tax=unclassified Streptomyces TaxID=2593676 RepID=UPI00342BBFDE